MLYRTFISIFLILVLLGINYAIAIERCNVCYDHTLKIATDGENISWDDVFKQRQNILNKPIPATDNTKKVKIPLISHHIWITDEKSPKEVEAKNIAIIKKTLAVLNSNNKKWTHYLWVTSLRSVPKTLLSLKEDGIEIKEINTRNIPTLPIYRNEYNTAKIYNIGMANDIVRYLALKNYGGVYFDMDYELYSPLDDIHSMYNLYATEYGNPQNYYITVSLVGAAKDHPIINKALLLAKRNMSKITAPYYVRCACHKEAKTVLATGAGMFSVAFYLQNNKDGNNDVLFTDNDHLYNKDTSKIHTSKIGKHYNTDTWLQEGENKLFPHCTNCLKYQ